MNILNLFKGNSVTHDYSAKNRYWGHDYTFEPTNGGKTGRMMGWGNGIKKGDYLLLQNGAGTTRYKVKSIKYFSDPSDMWSATVEFAPRKEK